MSEDDRRNQDVQAEVERHIREGTELAVKGRAIADEIKALAKALADLELINNTDTIGTPKVNAARMVMIEADHPDGGPWLYAFAGDGSGTIVATRMRDAGSYEHSALDEHGLPIEWRTAPRPEFN